MSKPAKTAFAEREFEFTDVDFACVRELLESLAGIAVSENKRDMIYARLAGRLRAIGLRRVSDYCDRLRGGQDVRELEHFRNAMTTNLTGFFREPYHFDFLREQARGWAQAMRPQGRHLRIWSAGCSTGEEAYSIAIALREAIPDIDDWDVRILASDLNSEVLARARRG